MSFRSRHKAKDVYLKSHTEGTSNEVSLSVLDATKDALESQEKKNAQAQSGQAAKERLLSIRLFTFKRKRKTTTTPQKDQEIIYGDSLHESAGGQSGDLTSVYPLELPETPPEPPQNVNAKGGKHVRDKLRAESVEVVDPLVAEIAGRKKSRIRRKRLVVATVCALVAVAVGVGIAVLVNYVAHQNSLRDELSRAIVWIDEADVPLMTLDAMISYQVSQGVGGNEEASAEGAEATVEADGATSESADTIQNPSIPLDDLKPQLEESKSLLMKARATVETLQNELQDDRDREVTREALDTIDARFAMIDLGISIMESALPLREAQSQVQQGWKDVLKADADAREAASIITNTNAENAQNAIQRNQEAIKLLQSAHKSFDEAQTLCPEVDLGAYGIYMEMRIEALKAAIASDQAYLNRDRESAQQQNDRYNEMDNQAAAQAQKLSKNPAVVIGNRLVEALSEPVQTYNEYRQTAGAADVYLRNFLDSRPQ